MLSSYKFFGITLIPFRTDRARSATKVVQGFYFHSLCPDGRVASSARGLFERHGPSATTLASVAADLAALGVITKATADNYRAAQSEAGRRAKTARRMAEFKDAADLAGIDLTARQLRIVDKAAAALKSA